MNPVLLEIYITYFEQEYWRCIGIHDNCALASAIQMRLSHSRALNSFTLSKSVGGFEHLNRLKNAFDFVKKHSTVPNI